MSCGCVSLSSHDEVVLLFASPFRAALFYLELAEEGNPKRACRWRRATRGISLAQMEKGKRKKKSGERKNKKKGASASIMLCVCFSSHHDKTDESGARLTD